MQTFLSLLNLKQNPSIEEFDQSFSNSCNKFRDTTTKIQTEYKRAVDADTDTVIHQFQKNLANRIIHNLQVKQEKN